MKYLKIIFSLLFTFLLSAKINAQYFYPTVKPFSPSELKKVKLLVPDYWEQNRMVTKVFPKGFFDKYKGSDINHTRAKRSEVLADIIKKGISESSFNYLDYEIAKFNHPNMKKNKKQGVAVLWFEKDSYNNWYAKIDIFYPKHKTIAKTIINGLNISNPKDFSIMMNMLNYSFSEAGGFYSEKSKYPKGKENIFRKNMLQLFANVKEKILIIPKITTEQDSKADKFNQKNSDYMSKSWRVCDYEFVEKSDIKSMIKSNKDKSLYMRSFKFKTDGDKLLLDYWVLFDSKTDEMVYGYLGKMRSMRSSELKVLNLELNKIKTRYKQDKKKK